MQPNGFRPLLPTLKMQADAPFPWWNIESRDLLLLMDGKGSTQCYRMVDEQVEFQRSPFGRWESLAPAQLLQHLWVETLVADWIRRRSRFARPQPPAARRAAALSPGPVLEL
jgi:hypothetical protein